MLLLGASALSLDRSAAQRLASPRLDALLARHGWIKLTLGGSVREATVTVNGQATIIADTASSDCATNAVELIYSNGAIEARVPGKAPFLAQSLMVAGAGNTFAYKGRQYRGRVQAVAGGGGITVINEVMIDDWLKGVLPAEIGSDSPLEALKAQAIAARSEAIFRLSHPPHKSEGYDFCTGEHCQAYKGISEETAAIRQACDATLGYVLVAQDDVVNAVYHNVCGGATAAAEDVWDGDPEPGLRPVFDTLRGGSPNLQSEAAAGAFLEAEGRDCFCYPGNPGYAEYAKKYFRWTRTLDAGAAGRAAGVGTLTDIRVIERRPSGRVRRLQVVGTSGQKVIEKELPIRRMFDLWSGLFVIKVENAGGRLNSVTFIGGGNGHGVGLCQHGAREIARRGGTFDQILGHYYPGATLRKVYRP